MSTKAADKPSEATFAAARRQADAVQLPESREALLAMHRKARQRRDAAPLLSEARAEAAFEIERIEIQIARVERAMDPPLV